jgi:hypothetical protein
MILPRCDIKLIKTLLIFDSVLVERLFFLGELIIAFFKEPSLTYSPINSTALMLGVPAQVAGCKTITLATPPRPDGSISPEIVYIAQLTGVSTIVKAGGAQAIASMAYGTETVPKADKIYGPGNQFVTAAKMVSLSFLPDVFRKCSITLARL